MLRNTQHCVQDHNALKPPTQSFPNGTEFIFRKPEQLLLEGLLWRAMSHNYLAGLTTLLWKMFPQLDQESQRWRQTLFACATTIRQESTVTGSMSRALEIVEKDQSTNSYSEEKGGRRLIAENGKRKMSESDIFDGIPLPRRRYDADGRDLDEL